ncbi:beta-1,6-N-acetylglucosaminyltransferase [Kineococcus terrestris]|uniref:beta-1,6-N-acetylglucosaminyltransferase n=1 Tax=Kineococcus terrestris TaxID=2044856 RepID=UPI0034DB69B5
MTAVPAAGPPLACVVLAHDDPPQVRRLVEALDPFPVFLHCDAATPEPVFRAMVEGLPARCRLLERRRTRWATWDGVEVELDGYRRALSLPHVTHVALLSGSDYPLASSSTVSDFVGTHPGSSFAEHHSLPFPGWGVAGGMHRLRFAHTSWRRKMLRLPVPRRLPEDVAFHGGSAYKVLAREHVEALLRVVDDEPGLVRFWRRAWAPDESFIPSVLNTPRLVPGYAASSTSLALWYIGWGAERRKSPPWLTLADMPALRRARGGQLTGHPMFFARKLSTSGSPGLPDAIDRELRAADR